MSRRRAPRRCCRWRRRAKDDAARRAPRCRDMPHAADERQRAIRHGDAATAVMPPSMIRCRAMPQADSYRAAASDAELRYAEIRDG